MTKGRMKVMQLAGKMKKMGTKGIAMAVAGVMLLSACPLPAQAFAYHDNDIRFENEVSQYEIWSGAFEIEDLGISEGQDPEHYNYVGKAVPLAEEGGNAHHFRFRVGRHSTEDIVEGWNRRFDSENTVYGSCSVLSFWFMGRLNLTIRERKTDQYYSAVFENVGMAQLHDVEGKDPWHLGQVCATRSRVFYLDTYGTARDQDGNDYTVKITYEKDKCSSYEYYIRDIVFYPQ